MTIPDVTVFGPDFPFAYDHWVNHRAGIGTVPDHQLGTPVAVIGAGISGMVCAYELMKLGLKPIVYEAGRIGGRLRSEHFAGPDSPIAELGGMRFPRSASAFNHYVDVLGLERRPFPNPLTKAAGTTVIDLAGVSRLARRISDLPVEFGDMANAWEEALRTEVSFSELQAAIRHRDTRQIKEIWDPLVKQWDDRTFYDFIASAPAFRRLSFRHKEIFGQVGFGTGGWDSDFSNTMLEILRVVVTQCDDHQDLIVGGAEQIPRGLWLAEPQCRHWASGTSVASLNKGATRSAARRIHRDSPTTIEITDQYGNAQRYGCVIATCQSWLLTTSIDTDESMFSQEHWMALDRTSYMQSSKTFVMVDRPFWKDLNPDTGEPVMSTTLSDRLTRGTYLFDNGENNPAVICLSYSWKADALKMLPLSKERRVELALNALNKIYPKLDIRSHIVGQPLTISWEADPNFLGAFKGALPGHYRYNRRMFTHFMQHEFDPAQRGIFIAGDDVSWTPGWAEGAVQTGLNAVWGVLNFVGGHCSKVNPGPGDIYNEIKPVALGN
ncbi:MAG: NAD(P)/FAD-dependent oxidoreductase [Granulosicoccus sp.]|nr:NAD(P)/FAD-dependent oxidoreductase [Granulosicoccus sp.]